VIDVTQPVEVPSMDRRWWARVVSEALGPVPLGAALCVGVGAASDRWAGVRWGLLAAGFAAVLPYVATWRLRHPQPGAIVSRRVRVAYLLVTLACAVAGVLLVGLLGGPHRVTAVAITIVAGLAVAAAINTRYRLSNHACAAAGGTVILAVLYGPIFLVGFLIAVAVGWSRFQLGRHTVGEVAAGAVVGAVVCAVVLPLLI
jgi:membrane-associated phospholipid phosphatase